jgi:cytochrome P450
VLGDPRFGQRPLRVAMDLPGFLEAIDEGPESSGDLATMDPPEHTRLRRLQTGYFTVRRIEEHRGLVERIVSGQLDAMEEAGPPADFVELFAFPVPSMSICEILGVPSADRGRFEHPTAVLMAGLGSTPEEKKQAMEDFYEYTHVVIEQKRARPGDDILSDLMATGALTDAELAGVAWFLFGAGHHTTARMFRLTALLLLTQREHWETLRADPSLIEGAVEELLRYLTINGSTLARTATEDVEIDGIVIKAGESVTVSLEAANRDPAMFPDPDRFDPTRDATGQLSFVHGRHMCLGQHLARLELRVGLEGLIQRFPDLRLAVPPDEVPIQAGDIVSIPVSW